MNASKLLISTDLLRIKKSSKEAIKTSMTSKKSSNLFNSFVTDPTRNDVREGLDYSSKQTNNASEIRRYPKEHFCSTNIYMSEEKKSRDQLKTYDQSSGTLRKNVCFEVSGTEPGLKNKERMKKLIDTSCSINKLHMLSPISSAGSMIHTVSPKTANMKRLIEKFSRLNK